MTTSTPDDHTSLIRRAELEAVARHFKAADRVLEIGGGSGFQATLLSALAAHVDSIDVAPHPNPAFPVALYDGHTIPFADGHFDVVFSSNVLEHIADLDRVLRESRRVLKDGGMAVHVVPAPAWRIYTTLLHYPALPRLIYSNYRNLKAMQGATQTPDATPNRGNKAQTEIQAQAETVRFKAKWIRTILLSPRHGERGNELTEAWYYRRAWWRERFEATGWNVVEDYPLEILYSGNMLLGTTLSISRRRRLSRILGSATRAFVLKKR